MKKKIEPGDVLSFSKVPETYQFQLLDIKSLYIVILVEKRLVPKEEDYCVVIRKLKPGKVYSWYDTILISYHKGSPLDLCAEIVDHMTIPYEMITQEFHVLHALRGLRLPISR